MHVVIDPKRDGAKLDALVRVDIVSMLVVTKDGHFTIGEWCIIKGGAKKSFDFDLIIVGNMSKCL